MRNLTGLGLIAGCVALGCLLSIVTAVNVAVIGAFALLAIFALASYVTYNLCRQPVLEKVMLALNAETAEAKNDIFSLFKLISSLVNISSVDFFHEMLLDSVDNEIKLHRQSMTTAEKLQIIDLLFDQIARSTQLQDQLREQNMNALRAFCEDFAGYINRQMCFLEEELGNATKSILQKYKSRVRALLDEINEASDKKSSPSSFYDILYLLVRFKKPREESF